MRLELRPPQRRKKIAKFIYPLRRLKNISSDQTALLAFHSYIMSNLRYGLIKWGNSSNKDRIFRLQKKCIRSIYGINQMESCRPYFIDNRILTFPSLYIYEVCIFVKNNPDLFPVKKSTTQAIRTKYMYDIIRTNHKSALFSKSIICMSIKIFNKLPTDLKKLPSLPFKNKLFDWLVKQCFYSINDFLLS